MTKPKQDLVVKDAVEMTNSLSGLVNTLMGPSAFGGLTIPGSNPYTAQVSQTTTFFQNNRWYLISNLRNLLNEMYVEHGIVQTLVDQPVDDAFSKGIIIKTSELDKDELEDLMVYLQEFQVLETIKQGIKWKRLFGGGGILILTDQDPRVPFNIKRVTEDSPLEFRAVDMWELYTNCYNWEGGPYPGEQLGANCGDFYQYYSSQVHYSRVMRMEGKQAPSLIRPRLRGWGMSELERLVRSLNQYLKNQDVIFELLDEAKVDVYRIKGFNAALLNKPGTQAMAQRIQMANMIKGYNSALVMDMDDEYEQKDLTFTGLAEMLVQIRQGIAADLKMPVTKLFGISAAGFNSGEDEIENYNSMIESEIRAKDLNTVVRVLQICCQKLFGFVPTDMLVEFPSLRILKETEQEEVKNAQFNRLQAALSCGAIDRPTWAKGVNKASLLPIEIDESEEMGPPLEGVDLVGSEKKVDAP